MKKIPIIVFGANIVPSVFPFYKNDNLMPKYCKTDADLGIISKDTPKLSRGIVFLAEDFKVGADIKFAQDAYVIIIAREAPDHETLVQKLARGSRAGDDYRGRLFVTGNSIAKDSIETANMDKKAPDLMYGAKYIDIISKIIRINKGAYIELA